jgi:hypothetical protein
MASPVNVPETLFVVVDLVCVGVGVALALGVADFDGVAVGVADFDGVTVLVVVLALLVAGADCVVSAL